MIWRVSPSGDRALFQDEVLDFSILAFVSDGRIYAAARVVGLAAPLPFEAVYGPFAHFSALTDAVAAFLLMLEADDDDGRVVVEVADAALPVPPPVPANRAFSAEMMAPGLLTDLLWEAQQLLDTGADAAAGVGDLEAHYGGERYDAQPADAYRAQGRPDTLVATPVAAQPVREPAPVAAVALQPAPMTPPQAARPVEIAPPQASDLRPIATKPRLDSVRVGPVPSRDTGMVTNMPRAAVPKADPFVVVDWSTLPVHVVEEKLSRDFSLLRSQWRRRATVRV